MDELVDKKLAHERETQKKEFEDKLAHEHEFQKKELKEMYDKKLKDALTHEWEMHTEYWKTYTWYVKIVFRVLNLLCVIVA